MAKQKVRPGDIIVYKEDEDSVRFDYVGELGIVKHANEYNHRKGERKHRMYPVLKIYGNANCYWYIEDIGTGSWHHHRTFEIIDHDSALIPKGYKP